MKRPSYPLIAIMSGVVLALPGYAGEEASPKGVIAPPAPECSTRELSPLFSRYAQTAKAITLRAGYRDFKDVELQEADSFDGTTLDAEIIVPLSDSLQLRFYYPYSTDGEARHIASGSSMDIDGSGGLLDYPSLILDYQFKHATSPGDYNLAAYFGIGYVLQHLEAKITTPGKTYGSIDRYNHRGAVALFGLKADRQLNNCWTFVGNIGGRYYWDSDDIHPNSDSDKFFLVDASAALIYNPNNAWIYPAVELVYQGDVSDYNSLQVVPQVIIPFGSHVDLNAGVSFGLLDDGPSTEARVQLNVRF
ncbi:MAG: hypothetical protein H7A51_17665 [Akkermansiaceae bacterium]|nr:hypothetical protein [Akkermansiaceae bacterium]